MLTSLRREAARRCRLKTRLQRQDRSSMATWTTRTMSGALGLGRQGATSRPRRRDPSWRFMPGPSGRATPATSRASDSVPVTVCAHSQQHSGGQGTSDVPNGSNGIEAGRRSACPLGQRAPGTNRGHLTALDSARVRTNRRLLPTVSQGHRRLIGDDVPSQAHDSCPVFEADSSPSPPAVQSHTEGSRCSNPRADSPGSASREIPGISRGACRAPGAADVGGRQSGLLSGSGVRTLVVLFTLPPRDR